MSLQQQNNGKIFNLHNPNTISWRQFITWTQEYGFPIKLVAPDMWCKKLANINKDNAIFPLINYYIDGGHGDLGETKKIKYDKTQKALHDIDIKYPQYNKKYIFKLLDYLVQVSFLKKP